jgi:1-acyl-sn-glycerol-3-phosphate acyltransferase
MNGWLLFFLTILILLLPLWLTPDATRRRNRRPKPEIHGILSVFHTVIRAYCAIQHRLRVVGPVLLPEQGPAILIANHTCMIDHLVLQSGCPRVLGFMIAREYYEWPPIHWICSWIGCIPVNRNGQDLSAIRAGLRAIEEGRVVPIFPEGKITPKSGRELGEIRPGAAFLAIRAGVPVIPAYIRGTPESNEIVPSLLTPSRAVVTFGPPIDLSDIDRGQSGDRDAQAEVSRRFLQAFLELKARSGRTQSECSFQSTEACAV